MSEDSENSFRFERKYHICESTPEEVEDWVLRCPALFREAYSPRFVNNIYLDSPDLASYFQNLAGVADRTKLRIRWYGDLFGPIGKPVLEYKIKRGTVGTKESHSLKPFIVARGFSGSDLRPMLDDPGLPGPVQAELAHVEPVLINRYRRKYFISANRAYRITVDSELEFYRVHRHDNQFLARSTLPDSTVMELKYSGAISDLDDRITNFFPFRVTRMSKYVSGLEGVEG
ncbi:MAG TPA: polyphosphate polymerase domain-containing protein [Verrucomicrobiota bacterium]|nr:hypothetical protein [Verrucomicrobiales bacterium]HRI14681.1 polyphosphate polymerase domain-containing protein [Verrucomicrobiota bacterium]